ncbi:MAG TPA: hypothetical protein VEI97_13015, partial [bacterium]|nr:hypothetical protein [bacterium]
QAGNLIATPYAAVADDRITIEAENPSGDGGVFQGDLDRTELRIEGTFVARIDGRDESGDFFVDKR